MTDLERLIELVERGIDTGRVRLTTHERDIFDGIRRRNAEPVFIRTDHFEFGPVSKELIEDATPFETHIRQLLHGEINR